MVTFTNKLPAAPLHPPIVLKYFFHFYWPEVFAAFKIQTKHFNK